MHQTGWGWLTVEKGDELVASALRAQRKSNGRESVNRVEAKQDIVVLGEKVNQQKATRLGALSPPYLQFIDQDGDGIELIAGVGCISHGGRLLWGYRVVERSAEYAKSRG